MPEYQLYVGKIQPITEDIIYSYYDSARGYLFVFANGTPEGKFAQMTDELMKELSAEEIRWYNQCCYEVNAKFTKEHASEIEPALMEMLDKLEEELRAEAEKMQEKPAVKKRISSLFGRK